MNKKDRDEKGDVVVEATIILPIAILCVILLLYVSVFVYQKAILQAALETSIVYFKNTLTDNFVEQNEEVSYTAEDDGARAEGNHYRAEQPLNPYAKFTTWNKKVSKADFEKYFNSITGTMLFADDLEVNIKYHNYILYKEIEVTAEQIVKFPIDFSLIGVDNEVNLSASAKVAVVDHDEMIRNMDYAVDIFEETKIGEMAKKIAGQIGDLYNKMGKWLE